MYDQRSSQSEHRKRRLLLAYATTGGSKFFALGVQLIALPIASSALSGDRFGALFVLAAIGSFISIAGQGFSPAISFVLSDSRGRGTTEKTRRAIWTMLALAIASGLAALIVGLLGSVFIDPLLLVGDEARPFASEVSWGLAALSIHVAIYYLFGFVDGARAAYLENHITNLCTSAASIAIVVFAVLAAQFRPTIGTFYLAMFTPQLLFQGISLGLMLKARRAEWGAPAFDREIATEITSRSLSYSRSQIGNTVYLHATVYVAAQAIGLQAGALVGAIVRLFILIHSTLLSLLTPFLPSLTHALASKDLVWAHRSVRRVLMLTFAVPFVVGTGLALTGHWIFELWLGLRFPDPSLEAVSFALMGAAYMSTHLNYMVLTALGDPSWGATRILLAGLVGITLGLAAAHYAGLAPLVATQAISMFLLAAVPIFLRLRRSLQELEQSASTDPPHAPQVLP